MHPASLWPARWISPDQPAAADGSHHRRSDGPRGPTPFAFRFLTPVTSSGGVLPSGIEYDDETQTGTYDDLPQVNPSGQYGFIEVATGLPITAAIADYLEGKT